MTCGPSPSSARASRCLTGGDPLRPTRAAAVPTALTLFGVAEQIAYPLLAGRARDALTVAVVVTLAAAALAHAAATRGPAVAVGVLLLTAVPGFAVEVLGVHTGFPFGHYRYSGALGPRWFGVPPVIGLAWTMLAWPALVVARTLTRSLAARIVLGGWALAVCDVFLDPQMVDRGYWTWRSPSPHLPGVDTVPLTNFAGWLVCALVLSAALTALVHAAPVTGSDTVPRALYLWLWAGWVVALGVFGHLGAAAGWGALAMGTVAVPVVAQHVRRAHR